MCIYINTLHQALIEFRDEVEELMPQEGEGKRKKKRQQQQQQGEKWVYRKDVRTYVTGTKFYLIRDDESSAA